MGEKIKTAILTKNGHPHISPEDVGMAMLMTRRTRLTCLTCLTRQPTLSQTLFSGDSAQ